MTGSEKCNNEIRTANNLQICVLPSGHRGKCRAFARACVVISAHVIDDENGVDFHLDIASLPIDDLHGIGSYRNDLDQIRWYREQVIAARIRADKSARYLRDRIRGKIPN